MESIRLFMCALLLGPAVALAQAEEPAEEVTVEESAPADEAAPAEATPEATAEESTPQEGMSSADAAAAEQGAGEEAAAPAEPRGGHHVDVFYLPTTEVDADFVGIDERGDGAGARGLFRFGQHLAASAEYQTQKFGDNDEVELTQNRAAIGFVGDDDDAFFGLFLEYDKLESDELDNLDGYSVHGRLSAMRTEWLGFYGDLGYLRLEGDLEKYSGNELTLGMLVKFGQFGVFADARRTSLEGKDSGGRASLTDVRAGVRYEFGKITAE